MKFFTYILESSTTERFYIGSTNNLEKRIIQHNKGYNKSTKSDTPWKLIHYFSCSTRSEAFKLEMKLKKMKSRKRVLSFINNSK
ncbi:GIY-YIG nuclease family protein [Salibacter sp.]|uniref:GIY-YIG nuclease family protein n=1 Tax=Salibacter sp. TaxID=2010995 RepID=UPI002870A70C|nr:GIY-YIG nuclease family protein [Salibacter sp.]MDR9487409.1 GIY-YIG nuclease family protein [Salibacter sp.]